MPRDRARIHKDDMTTGDLGGPGQAPLTVEPTVRGRRIARFRKDRAAVEQRRVHGRNGPPPPEVNGQGSDRAVSRPTVHQEDVTGTTSGIRKADPLLRVRRAGEEWLVVERKTQHVLSRHPDRGTAVAQLQALTADYEPAQELRRRPNSEAVAKTGSPKKLWIGLQVPEPWAHMLAIKGGEAPVDLHLTLGMFPYPGQDAWQHMVAALRALAQRQPPVVGRISGAGRFEQPDGGVVYAIFDSPTVLAFRHAVLEEVRLLGGPAPLSDHGFVPHITLAYTQDPQPDVPLVPPLDVAFPAVTMSDGETDRAFVLCGAVQAPGGALAGLSGAVVDEAGTTAAANNPMLYVPASGVEKAGDLTIEQIVAALRTDAQAELDAINQYSRHRDALADESIRADLTGIIEDEKDHYRIFNGMIDRLDPPAPDPLEKARTRRGTYYDNRVHGRNGPPKPTIPVYRSLTHPAQGLLTACKAALDAGESHIEWAQQVIEVEAYCRPLLAGADPEADANVLHKALAALPPRTIRAARRRAPIPQSSHRVGNELPDSTDAAVPFDHLGTPATSVANAADTYSLHPSAVMKTDDAKRYTFTVVYLATTQESKPETDAHNEFITDDELYQARLDYVRGQSRTIFVQHGVIAALGFRRAGEWVDLVQWPLAVTTEFMVPGEPPQTREIPAGSVWMGVVWDPWCWPLVRDGKIRGFSLGGRGKRVLRD